LEEKIVEQNKEIEKLINRCGVYEDKIEELQSTISILQDQDSNSRTTENHYHGSNSQNAEALVTEIIALKKKISTYEEQQKSGANNLEENKDSSYSFKEQDVI
jgi:prefoldin subunit 5